jgi:hypothetical protein
MLRLIYMIRKKNQQTNFYKNTHVHQRNEKPTNNHGNSALVICCFFFTRLKRRIKVKTCIYANSHTQLDEHQKLFANKKQKRNDLFLHRVS